MSNHRRPEPAPKVRTSRREIRWFDEPLSAESLSMRYNALRGTKGQVLAYGPYNKSLSSTGEELVLKDSSGAVRDRVRCTLRAPGESGARRAACRWL
jgi:hypothetical protein